MTETKLLVPIRTPTGGYDVFEATPNQMDWPALRSVWLTHNVSMPLCFAPPEEKLDLFFFYACRAHEVPSSLASVFEPRAAQIQLNHGEHDCLVCSATVSQYVLENGLFAEQLQLLNCIVFVGEISSDKKEAHQLFSKKPVEFLSHPVRTLAENA